MSSSRRAKTHWLCRRPSCAGPWPRLRSSAPPSCGRERCSAGVHRPGCASQQSPGHSELSPSSSCNRTCACQACTAILCGRTSFTLGLAAHLRMGFHCYFNRDNCYAALLNEPVSSSSRGESHQLNLLQCVSPALSQHLRCMVKPSR